LGLKILLLAPLIPFGVWFGYWGLLRDRSDGGVWETLKTACILLLGELIGSLAFVGMIL
jgi:hypothetical protein